MDKKLPDNQIAFYQSPDGTVNIEVFYAEENIWLTQKKIAELFNTTKQNISLHLKNIFKESELQANSVVKDFLTTASDGKTNHEAVELLAVNIINTKKCK